MAATNAKFIDQIVTQPSAAKGDETERERIKSYLFYFLGGVGERGSQKCVIQFHIKPNKPREKCEEKVKINARRVAKRSTKSAQGFVAE